MDYMCKHTLNHASILHIIEHYSWLYYLLSMHTFYIVHKIHYHKFLRDN